MYNHNDIQAMLDNLNNDTKLLKRYYELLEHTNSDDRMAIMYVIKDGYYESFDRYDSDVCEQFITLYEKSVKGVG